MEGGLEEPVPVILAGSVSTGTGAVSLRTDKTQVMKRREMRDVNTYTQPQQ